MSILARVWRFALRLSMVGLRKGPHVTRYTMYERLAACGKTLAAPVDRALSISHSARLIEIMNFYIGETVEANYPHANMLDLPFADSSFDLVVSDQVLEHLEGNPQAAIDECIRVLRPGGIVVHTTCFMNPVHKHPGDFWRYTPEALEYLHRDLDILDSGGWGNWPALFLIMTGARRVRIPIAKWHPLNRIARRGNAAVPIVTWVVARKPRG